jgi:uncharacterized membrane protein
MTFDTKYVVWSWCFAAVGMGLGVYMGASQNHSELVAHAHILLVGFVVSFIYGIIHRLWLPEPNRAIATFQFALHQAGALTLMVGLFLLYGNFVAQQFLDPILGIASVLVLVAMLTMIYMVFRYGHRKAVV